MKIGDRVAAFLEQGGAYAAKAVAPANMLMHLPDALPFDVGAALTVQPLTGYHRFCYPTAHASVGQSLAIRAQAAHIS